MSNGVDKVTRLTGAPQKADATEQPSRQATPHNGAQGVHAPNGCLQFVQGVDAHGIHLVVCDLLGGVPYWGPHYKGILLSGDVY